MSVDQSTNFVKHQNVTFDAFLGGKLTIAQPKKGFRAGLDSVLLGASVAPDTSTILDLGAGAGVAGLVAATHVPAAAALLVERDPAMLELAEHNIEANGFATRCRAVSGDVTAPGPQRQAVGMVPDHFTSVIANPPFFDAAGGTLADNGARADARHMPAGTLERWVRTAAAAVAPRGEVIFINRADLLGELLAAFSSRLGAIAVLPIAPRPGQPASRVLVRGIKGSRSPLSLLPPLVLHGAEGNDFAAKAAAILRGTAPLDW